MASPDDFGEIPGIEFGRRFKNKVECNAAGVHRSQWGGVHGSEALGAASICISGGYEDNKDMGNIIYYTGSGGQDDDGAQVGDQTFTSTPSNRALYTSFQQRRAVRVIRGQNKQNATNPSPYAPASGYRYDGLYYVDDAQIIEGRSKHKVCQFKLVRIIKDDMPPIPHKRNLTPSKLKRMTRGSAR